MAELVATSLNTTHALTLSAQLYKNIESYPGQILVTPQLMSAKREGRIARKDAVRGARQVERTSGHIAGGIDRSTDMVIGGRLIARPMPDWESLGITDREARKAFVKACKRAFISWGYSSRNLCDAEGHYNFSGLMWLSFRNLKGPDAESAGIIHYDRERRQKYRTPWATFITVLDPDRVATPGEKANDPNVFEGRQLDEHGRMTGIYVRKGHPADGWTGTETEQFSLVPRETWWGRAMSWHWFVKTRGQQQRGLTRLVTVLRRSTMLDQFDDAQLGAAVIAAVLQTFIKTTASAETMAEQLAPAKDGQSVVEMKMDYYDKAKIRIGTQRIPLLAPNDEIIMASVARAIADPTAFRTGFMREFGMALGIGQGQIANSFADFNYSSARAELLEVFRGVLRERRMFTSHVAGLTYAAVIEEAVELGIVQLQPGWPPFQENRDAYTQSEWTGPGMGSLDPLKEANARLVLLQSKTKSHTQLAAEDGEDFEETLDQIETDQADAEARGISLEIKPSAAALPADGGSSEEGSSKPRKKPNGTPGDGDGDGVANEEQP